MHTVHLHTRPWQGRIERVSRASDHQPIVCLDGLVTARQAGSAAVLAYTWMSDHQGQGVATQ